MSHSVISNNKMIILPIVACEVKNLIFNRKWICGPSKKTQNLWTFTKNQNLWTVTKNQNLWTFTKKQNLEIHRKMEVNFNFVEIL